MLNVTAIVAADKIATLQERAAKIEAATGINVLAIYCSATGKRLAMLDESAILTIDDSQSDDDLLTSAMLAARPSHGWIIKRKQAYSHFKEADPNGLLTHLVCLVFDALEAKHKKQSLEGQAYSLLWKTTASQALFMQRKIRLAAAIVKLPIETRDKALNQVVELDARKGLETIYPPRVDRNTNALMTLQNLLDDFLPSLARLLMHCELELAAARETDSKGGSYFARQMTGLLVDPSNPKHIASEKRARESSLEMQLAEAFFDAAGVDSLESLRELNLTLSGQSNTNQAANAPQIKLNVSVLTTRQRIKEYEDKTRQSRLITGGSLKL